MFFFNVFLNRIVGAGNLRGGIGKEVFCFLGWTGAAGESSCFDADIDLDEIVGRDEWIIWLVNKKRGHDFVPDGRGAGDAGGDIGHGGVVKVTDPDCGKKVVGKTNGPVVPHIIGGSCLDGDLVVGNDKV